MHTYARASTRIGRHMKESIFWSTITWPAMRKQNLQAERSVWKHVPTLTWRFRFYDYAPKCHHLM